MTFTVGLPKGLKDFEYEAYIRALERQGVDLVDAPRVIDPATGKRWLYATEDRADAERLAERVREEDDNPHWQVFELNGAAPSRGPLGPVEVLVGRQSEGYSYGLAPTSRRLVRRMFPEARVVSSVFIAGDPAADSAAAQRQMWDHIIFLLTGLTGPQLDELGGYRVVDPVARQTLREAPLAG
jgi:hypothetical protein